MNKKITLLVIVLIMLISESVYSQNSYGEKFYLGTFTFPNYGSYHSQYFFDKYDSLRYNLIVGYIGHFDYDPGCNPYEIKIWGGFFDNITDPMYTYSINSMFTGFNNYYQNKGGFSLFLEREKILRPAYGQSSRHEAELTSSDTNTIRPAYFFNTANGTIYQDPDGTKGRVLYASETPKYFVKDMFENLEMVNVITDTNNSKNRDLWYNMGDRKDSEHEWFIKPRIRIDSAFAANNLNTPVVAVVINDYNGNRTDSIILTCRNFGKLVTGIFQYNGSYTDRFYDNLPNNPPFYISKRSYDLGIPNNKCTPDASILDECKIDIRVYWYGQVTAWLDCVKIEDSWAHALLTDTTLLIGDIYKFRKRINDEVSLFAGKYGTVPKFYVDEFNYNMIPCINFVDNLVKTASGNQSSGVVCLLNDFWTREKCGGLRVGPGYSDNYSYLFKPGTTGNVLLTEIYPFDAILPLPITIPTLPSISSYPQTMGYHYASSNNVYNDSLHLNLETGLIYPEDNTHPGHIPSFMDRFRKCSKEIKQSNKFNSFIVSIPFHTEENPFYDAKMREPTVEEMSLMSYLSLAYGANGILQFSFNSKENDYDNGKKYYYWGIQDLDKNYETGNFCDIRSINRDINYYGQEKWKGIVKLDSAIRKIGDFIYDKTKGSLIYDDTRTINTKFGNPNETSNWGLPFKYVQDIQSYIYDPEISDYSNINYDPSEKRYWEFGFFNPRQSETNDNSKYLLAVNKRCAPGIRSIGDYRQLRIKFSPSQLSGFNNWTVKDAVTNNVLVTFDKNTNNFVTINEFLPGEGKLLKLTPVMQEGGTLVADETISGNINCDGKVNNSGFNINISPNTTISFSDNASIEMSGGNFTCGEYNSDSPVTLKGKTTSNVWNGLILSNCSTIGIYNTNISKIHANDTAKAVLISNCNNINISNTSFNMGTNAGAIQAVYTEIPDDEPVTFNVSNCSFNMGSSSYSAISILSNASCSLPVIIDWCNFSTTNENANAVTLSGVTGGAIKNNTFTNFASTINTLTSAIDLYSNTILGRSNSTGIFCVDGSSISLSPISGLYLGGFNYIRNYGGSSSNICSDNSLFNIHTGGNNFDLNETAGSKHLSGNFSGIPYSYVNAMKNCFHKDSITNIEAVHSVVWYDNSPVNLLFTPYICELTPPENYQLFTYNGYSDTVYYRSSGEVGGFNPNKSMNIEENVYKSLKDSININLRKRNYLTVENKAKQLLTQFPDSLESIGTVQKLYMASLNLDTSKIGLTKSFLENLIVTNTQNPGLVKRSFYFIQKCKVKLGQYQSALDGFQYIMTQNPYTYEGLVASWDYGATYLLMGTGGSYKGDLEQQTEELNIPADTLLNRMTKQDLNNNINTNKGKSTTTSEQITKTFYEKIKNITKDDKTTQEAKVKTLEKKIETTKSKTEKNDAETELAKMKQIKEVVKLKKPNTVMTHTAIINSDIKKVFGIGKKSLKETTNNLIPQTYALYQNYPNPFNPTTKIAYDIPTNAKVKLVIYDILGREMKTLINNEFRSAGKYITEFNGSNLASGIYFARILVNEGKDFMAVKKMVLVK